MTQPWQTYVTLDIPLGYGTIVRNTLYPITTDDLRGSPLTDDALEDIEQTSNVNVSALRSMGARIQGQHSDQMLLDRSACRLDAAVYIELAVDGAQVRINGQPTKHELVRDLGVG